jgi:NitT/TauT family transport system substrate-binding protein
VPTVLQARDGGLDLVVVAGTSVTDPQDRMGVLARPGANINSPQDFVGKKVGAPGLNAFMHVLFRQWLTDKGVDYNKVNFVEASFPQMSDLLKGGTVDAVLAVEPIVSRIAAEKSGVVVARYVAETPPATPVLYVAASRDWARANDATVKAFKAGMREASQFVAANPDESREIIGKYTKLPPQALAAVQIPVRRIDPSEEGLAYWVDMMTRQKLLQKKPELSSLIYR